MRIVAITQARTGSARLPGKVLLQIGDETLLGTHIKRVLGSKCIDKLVLATTTDPDDAKIVKIGNQFKIDSYRGSVDNVLDRFYQSLQDTTADYVVRLTSDCPLIDPELIDKVVRYAISNNLDYCSNTLSPTYPDGQDVEVFRYNALEKAWKEATLISEREHVTPFIWKNSTFNGGKLFTSSNFDEGFSYSHLRMTVDETSDFELIKNLVSALGPDKTWLEYANYIESNKEIKSINSFINRNEGYEKSINRDNE